MSRAGVGSAEGVGKWYHVSVGKYRSSLYTPLKDPEFGIRGPAEAFAPQIALQIYVCAGDLFVSSRSAVRVKVVKLAP